MTVALKNQQPATSEESASMPVALTLAGLASYKLAAVDEFAAAGAWQKFLGAFGLRKTRSLEIEAEGVEIADLPLDRLLLTLRSQCNDPNSILVSDFGSKVVEEAQSELNNYVGEANVTPSPTTRKIYLLKQIYYLRGIRYIWNDSNTTAVLLEAAAKAEANASGGTPSTINNITVATPPPATATGDVKTLETNIQALQTQLDSLTKALAGSNAVALTYARATARGIEFVSIFDRPLAFGYDAIAWNVYTLLKKGETDPNTAQRAPADEIVFRGLRKLCSPNGR